MATDEDVPGYEFMNSEGLYSIADPGVGLTKEGFRRLHFDAESLLLKPANSRDYGSAVEALQKTVKVDLAFTHDDPEINKVGESCRNIARHFSNLMTKDGDSANGVLAYQVLSHLIESRRYFPADLERSPTADLALNLYLRHQPEVVPNPRHVRMQTQVAQAARTRMTTAEQRMQAERRTGRPARPLIAPRKVTFPVGKAAPTR